MTPEELKALGEKVKSGQATQAEEEQFLAALTNALETITAAISK